jgi:hypothetical protein
VIDVSETLPVEIPASWAHFFTDVTDCKMRFTHDPNPHDYRLVSFMGSGGKVTLCRLAVTFPTFGAVEQIAF